LVDFLLGGRNRPDRARKCHFLPESGKIWPPDRSGRAPPSPDRPGGPTLAQNGTFRPKRALFGLNGHFLPPEAHFDLNRHFLALAGRPGRLAGLAGRAGQPGSKRAPFGTLGRPSADPRPLLRPRACPLSTKVKSTSFDRRSIELLEESNQRAEPVQRGAAGANFSP